MLLLGCQNGHVMRFYCQLRRDFVPFLNVFIDSGLVFVIPFIISSFLCSGQAN